MNADPVREWLARSRPGPNLDAPLETPAEIMARAGVNLSVRGTGGGTAHVGHGVGCVSLTVENRGSAAGMVLTPGEARTLAASLTRQAENAKEADQDGDG